jgi:hypothetical protein
VVVGRGWSVVVVGSLLYIRLASGLLGRGMARLLCNKLSKIDKHKSQKRARLTRDP